MSIRLGRVAVSVGPSMWPDNGLHWLGGWRFPPLLVRVNGERVVFGRGVVFALGGYMLWVTIEDRL